MMTVREMYISYTFPHRCSKNCLYGNYNKSICIENIMQKKNGRSYTPVIFGVEAHHRYGSFKFQQNCKNIASLL